MFVDRRNLIALLALCTTGLTRAVSAEDAGPAGVWTGLWSKGGDDLPVTVRFAMEADGLTGRFESDALQVADIPLSRITWAAPVLTFVLQGDASSVTFTGEVRGDEISGTLAEGTTDGHFRLARAISPLPAVREEELSVVNGGVTLSGTLLLPGEGGRRPAVVFLHGSGAEGRFANRYLARRFAEAGFAALIFDKRGVGRSGGDWREAGFENLAADGAAWAALLAGRPDIDPGRIGFYGHSQGGAILPLAATQAPGAAFLIASAASGLSPAGTERYSVGGSLGVGSLSGAEAAEARDFVDRIVAVAYEGADRASLDAAAARYRGRAWFFEPPPPEHHYWRFSARIAGYDPVAQWRRVRAPVLLLYGENDERVPPVPSAAAIRSALAEADETDVTVRIFPGADHAFRLSARPGGWPRRAPDYASVMIDWARART